MHEMELLTLSTHLKNRFIVQMAVDDVVSF
jgi:hypothetical protein